MTRRVRALAAGLGVVLGLAIPVAGAPGLTWGPAVACAAEGPRAVLVVDTGSRVHRLCVALDAPSVSGIHLIELASAQHGLSYSLGYGGQAVCRLDGVGPSGGDCFADYPDFWGYWHGVGGGWTWAGNGAASYRVDDGNVEGWSWGSGDAGSTHPAPPPTRADDVCTPATEPPPDDDPAPTNRDGTGDAGAGQGSVAEGTQGGDGGAPSERPSVGSEPTSGEPRERDRERGDDAERDRPDAGGATATPATDPARTDDGIRASGTTVPDAAGPSPAVVAAFGLAFALLLGGWWRTRRSGGRSL